MVLPFRYVLFSFPTRKFDDLYVNTPKKIIAGFYRGKVRPVTPWLVFVVIGGSTVHGLIKE